MVSAISIRVLRSVSVHNRFTHLHLQDCVQRELLPHTCVKSQSNGLSEKCGVTLKWLCHTWLITLQRVIPRPCYHRSFTCFPWLLNTLYPALSKLQTNGCDSCFNSCLTLRASVFSTERRQAALVPLPAKSSCLVVCETCSLDPG